MTSDERPVGGTRPLAPPVRALLVIALLYLFLGGVRLLENGIKGFGGDFTDALFESVSNPVAGLFVGILATVLVQSSSATTATIVGLVAAGVVDVPTAVPMIMGTNIGTTVTNTLVSLAHMRRSQEFRLAFTAAMMHDFFNLIVVAILLPIEILTGFLTKLASSISGLMANADGTEIPSPIKGAVKWLASQIEGVFESFISDGDVLASTFLITGLVLVIATLTFITKNMRELVAGRIESSLNAALAKSGMVGIAVGALVTLAVQSSSITTSILIPIVASGVLSIRNAFPITLGANVGTTITALLAALGAGSADGLTIALVHTLFNLFGILIVYPWPRFRELPIRLASGLAAVASERRALALVYVGTVFILIPLVFVIGLR